MILEKLRKYFSCLQTYYTRRQSSALRNQTLLICYHGINKVGIKLQVNSEEKWKREASKEEPFF